MPSMSSRVRPASLMAARQASIVRSSGARYNRRPMSDWPMPEMTSCRRNPARRSVMKHARREEREPHVVVVLVGDLHRHVDVDVVDREVDKIVYQPHALLLLDLADRDPVRQ